MKIRLWVIFVLMCISNTTCFAEKREESIFEKHTKLCEKAYKNFTDSKYMFEQSCYPEDHHHSGDYLNCYEYYGCLDKSYEFIDIAFKNSCVHSSMIDTLQNARPYGSDYLCLYQTEICYPLNISKQQLIEKEKFFLEKKKSISQNIAKKDEYKKEDLRNLWMKRFSLEREAYKMMEDALTYLNKKVDHPEASHMYDICSFQLNNALETDNDNAYLVQAIKSACKQFFEIKSNDGKEIIKHEDLKNLMNNSYKMYMNAEILKYQEEYINGIE